jgi:hypothetical protein
MYNQSNAILTCLKYRAKFIVIFKKIIFMYLKKYEPSFKMEQQHF